MPPEAAHLLTKGFRLIFSAARIMVRIPMIFEEAKKDTGTSRVGKLFWHIGSWKTQCNY
jgi:hypothetical protein